MTQPPGPRDARPGQTGRNGATAAGATVPSAADGARPAGPRSASPTDGTRPRPAGHPAANGQPTLDQLKQAVPERPKLAPNVEPAGQMRESAFVDPPWLVERKDEGYVQVTRLLYRIAEKCDGQRTVEQIAEEVSREEGRQVSPDNVRQLVATQLILKGLVVSASGKVVEVPSASRSPLQIARMKTLDPKTIEGVTGVLKGLFWPPVLVAIGLVSLAAQVWMYAIHGVGGSVSDAFNVPGFMLVVLATLVVSAGFHELGHAAALRYAGGQVKGMGAGMYLVYPAFYTDVSDNYRLSRWPRVRTDLGGFYFNLIFALVLFGLYAATRQEALLAVIMLMNFEIVHQLLPYLRLDGYWALADVTGIPDFFSRIGPFVRSVVPIKAWKDSGPKLPELKWWGKAIFGLYVALIVPTLLLLLFVMVRSVPRVLATAWEAGGKQAQGFQQAQAAGNALGMLGAAAQMLLVAFPVAALGYALFSMGKQGIAALDRWSEDSPLRKTIAAGGVLALLGLLYLLWAPSIPFFGNRPSPLYSPDTYRPIAREERLSLGDAAGGVAARREANAELPFPPLVPALAPVPAATPGASPTPAASPPPTPATPTLAGASTPAATLAPLGTQPVATPQPTSVPTPVVTAEPTLGLTTTPVATAVPTLAATLAPTATPPPSTPVAVSTLPATTPTPVLLVAPAPTATPLLASTPIPVATPPPTVAAARPTPVPTAVGATVPATACPTPTGVIAGTPTATPTRLPLTPTPTPSAGC